MGIEVSGEWTLDLKSQGNHSTAGLEVFSRSEAEAWAVEARRFHSERVSQLFSHTHVCFFLLLVHLFHPLVSVLSQGLDPPHQSETRTVYVANRFPQHGHYIPQRFADNRIISSKVLNVCRDIISLSWWNVTWNFKWTLRLCRAPPAARAGYYSKSFHMKPIPMLWFSIWVPENCFNDARCFCTYLKNKKN